MLLRVYVCVGGGCIWQSTQSSICLQDVKHPNGSHPPPGAIPYPPKTYFIFVTHTHYTNTLPSKICLSTHTHMHLHTLPLNKEPKTYANESVLHACEVLSNPLSHLTVHKYTNRLQSGSGYTQCTQSNNMSITCKSNRTHVLPRANAVATKTLSTRIQKGVTYKHYPQTHY